MSPTIQRAVVAPAKISNRIKDGAIAGAPVTEMIWMVMKMIFFVDEALAFARHRVFFVTKMIFLMKKAPAFVATRVFFVIKAGAIAALMD